MLNLNVDKDKNKEYNVDFKNKKNNYPEYLGNNAN